MRNFNFFISLFVVFLTTGKIYAEEEKAMPEEAATQIISEFPNLEIDKEVVVKELPYYKYNLKQLIEAARKNIEKVDEDIKQRKFLKIYQEKEEFARDQLLKGNLLYREGKLEEAKREWQRVLDIAEGADKKYIYKAKEIEHKDKRIKERKEKEEKGIGLFYQRKESQKDREKAKSLYKQALRLFRDKKYDEAYKKFQEVQELIPDYARSNYYLERIPEDIDRQKEGILRELQKIE